MHPISWSAGPNPIDDWTPALPAGGRDGTAALLGVRTERSITLDITTAEGDRVTISAARVEEAAAVTYDGTGRLSHSVSRTIGVTIEGELSANEARDLGKVVKRLAHDHADRGNRLTALARQIGRAPLDSIASVSATFTSTGALVAGLLRTPSTPENAPVEPLPSVALPSEPQPSEPASA